MDFLRISKCVSNNGPNEIVVIDKQKNTRIIRIMIAAIKDIIGDRRDVYIEGEFVGEFISHLKPDGQSPKIVFMDRTSQERYNLTIFSDNLIHKDLLDKNMKKGDVFKYRGGMKFTSKGWLNLNDKQSYSLDDPSASEIPPKPDNEPKEQKDQLKADVAYIRSQIDLIEDEEIKGVCNEFTRKYGDEFMNTAAAHNHHHAFRRGLARHTVEVMEFGIGIAEAAKVSQYEMDLVRAGCLLHDCGKIFETLHVDGHPTPNNVGGLLGHIEAGVAIMRECFDSYNGMPVAYDYDKSLHLAHIILSHHGMVKWGSPIEPRTVTARIVHEADNLSAKISPMVKIKDGGESFDNGYYSAGKDKHFIDVNNSL